MDALSVQTTACIESNYLTTLDRRCLSEVRADDDQDVTLSTQDFLHRSPQDADRPNTDRSAATDQALASIITAQLSERLGAERYDLWFGEPNCLRVIESECDPVVVSIHAENAFSLQRIQSTFGRDIRQVVDRVCGPQVSINFCVAKKAKKQVEQASQDPANQPVCQDSQGLLSFVDGLDDLGGNVDAGESRTIPIRPSSTGADTSDLGRSTASSGQRSRRRRNVQSFWFGEENRLAEASVEQLFLQPGEFSPFFVYGPTGCGKSHLLEAVVNDFRSKLRLRRCVMLSAEQFTSLFVSSLQGGSGLPMFRRKYRDLDLLVIDDIQFFAGKRATMSEFQHTIDNLIRIGKQVIVAADRPPLELGSLGGELGTRLTAGLSCPLRYPGFEGRVKIARQMCLERKIKLSTAVIELISERLTRDVRRISGALNRMHALMLSTGTKITPEIAQTELSDLFSTGTGNLTSLLNIEAAVCEYCGVKPADLKSSSRHKQISTARMLAMYLSREYTASAFSEIGDYFGGRSHSTVIAAQKKVNQWLESNEGVVLPHATCKAKDVISRLESNLRIG